MTLIKTIHVVCAIVTVSGFFLRGVWMMTDSPMRQRRWVRIAPHVVDTVLLASAIWLALDIQQYPGSHAWLTAKVIGLLAYIGLGMVALRRGRTKAVRVAAWVGALGVFAYVVGVARTRSATLMLF